MGEMNQNGIESRTASCPEHGEFVSRALMLMGRSMGWSKCPTCNEIEDRRLAEEKRIAQDMERQSRMEARLNRAGIPPRFRSRSFDNFTAKTPEMLACLNFSVAFAADFSRHHAEGSTVVFSGKPGTGKSHLATSICQEVMASGFTALYANALDLIRMIRSTWKRDAELTESQVTAMLADVDLLVIDEVGAQYGTDGEQIIMFDIINRRYQDQKPIILLTNQGKDGFKQYLGDRAFDRLREAGKWMAFDWESHRGAA